MNSDIVAGRADFRALNEEGFFLLPSAWDVGSAKKLEALGFAAIASSNESLAWALGRENGAVARGEVLAHLRQLVHATELPVAADFGYGFAERTPELMENIRLAIDTGVAGLSIGDTSDGSLRSVPQAVTHIKASRVAIAQSGADVVLTARAEGLLEGRTNLHDVIGRLLAYAAAGADVVCAPGLADPTAIKAVVEVVAPTPLDIELIQPGLTAAELGALGVRRISVGDSFGKASRAFFSQVAQRFIDYGDFLPSAVAAKNGAAA